MLRESDTSRTNFKSEVIETVIHPHYPANTHVQLTIIEDGQISKISFISAAETLGKHWMQSDRRLTERCYILAADLSLILIAIIFYNKCYAFFIKYLSGLT